MELISGYLDMWFEMSKAYANLDCGALIISFAYEFHWLNYYSKDWKRKIRKILGSEITFLCKPSQIYKNNRDRTFKSMIWCNKIK